MNVRKQMIKAIPDIVQNKYFDWYISLVERAMDWRPRLEHEDHHWIPYSIMESNNTVAMSYREHFVCHLLLTKFLKGHNRRKMLHAINLMIDINKYDTSNSRLYESLKQQLKYARARPIDLIRHSYEDGSLGVEIRPHTVSSAAGSLGRGDVLSTFDSIDELFETSETMFYHPSNNNIAGYVPVSNYSATTRQAVGRLNSVYQSGTGNSQYGTTWIYSEEEKRSKKIRITDDIPDGWQKGRKIKFEDNKEDNNE